MTLRERAIAAYREAEAAAERERARQEENAYNLVLETLARKILELLGERDYSEGEFKRGNVEGNTLPIYTEDGLTFAYYKDRLTLVAIPARSDGEIYRVASNTINNLEDLGRVLDTE